MRHNKKFNHLGRTAPHRKAMLANMSVSLIRHKRITTTLAKAKALRKYIEPLLTKAKEDTTHSRRTVFRYLQNKEAVTELFRDVAVKIADRPGGYTRILRTGYRLGDNAEMCIIELVDYNENMLVEKSAKKSARTRRSRKSASGGAEASKELKNTKAAEDTVSKDVEIKEEVSEAKTEETAPKKEEVDVLEADTEEAVVSASAEEKVKEDVNKKVQDAKAEEKTSEAPEAE